MAYGVFQTGLYEDNMKFCILMGSPRLGGNTAELLKPFISELEAGGADVVYITLSDKHISPCRGCYACQKISDQYGCAIHDDVPAIMQQIIASDCVVFATPVYTWYCTAPMKALLDRHFGLNKYYGSASGSLWAGKKVALVTTHGYEAEYGAGPLEMGIRRLCEHSKLKYLGMYSVRDIDDLASFQTPEAVKGSKNFAKSLLAACTESSA
jgi:multimeric flavodoxin WrbA